MSGTGDRLLRPESGSTDTSDPVTPSPSSESSRASRNNTPTMPMSPPRSQQMQQLGTSAPNSPIPPSAAERSPAVTPTPQKQLQTWPPQSTPSVDPTGVELGLEQLERQQEESERRRREKLANVSTPTTTPNKRTAPIVPSSTQTTPHAPQQRRPMPQQQQQQQASVPSPLSPSPVMMTHQHRQQQGYILDDDDHTAPSSTQESSGTVRDAGSHAGTGSLGSADDSHSAAHEQKESTKFGRMIQKTRRRLSSKDFLRRRNSGDLDDPAEEEEDGEVDALIYGHLQKLGRNGKWQTRWFETDGECLSYYKSSKRTKLLATLDLEKVGAIVVNEDDPKGCSFTIQVLGRPYYLRAESRAACKDWVITLNRVKEARLQQGNVKLVHQPKHILFRSPPDLLDHNVSTYTQGVVAVANRQRTRAVDESAMDNIEEMMMKGKAEPGDTDLGDAFYRQTEDTDSLSQVVLARWQKRKTSMSRLASKLSRWAKSLNKYKCSDAGNDVRLDRHVHPPGHDNPKRPVKTVPEVRVRSTPKDPGLSGWIGKETSLAVKGGPVVISSQDNVEGIEPVVSDPIPRVPPTVSPVPGDDDDGETRELS